MFTIVQRRKIWFLLSIVIIVPGIVAMIYNTITLPTHSPWRLSVDFREGNRFELKFTQPITEDQLRNTFVENGVSSPQITRLGKEADNTWQVRTEYIEGDKAQVLRDKLNAVVPLDQGKTSIESVSKSVADQVTTTAFVAVIVSSVMILLFIWITFRKASHSIRYSIAAIVAMVHDVLVAAGVMAIFSAVLGWEIDALFLTAILTVIGFSVPDTIVVYDRIRENLGRYKGMDFETIVSRSIVETLHRSLTISLINMLVMFAILVFGGASIRQFVAVLLIGLVSGTYSSIFTAVPMVVGWETGDFWGTKKKKAA
ncbi:MAG: protein translocase subunit SecF [Chloroflexi bacterium]|nr:protein translocase subunit SecF [Chloroflexota bacterium]